MSFKIYIEGGGEGQLLDTLFRQGWKQFFERAEEGCKVRVATVTGRIPLEEAA